MSIDGARSDSFILFDLAGTTYGLRSSNVLQLEMVENITPVPNADPMVEGVVFSRGQVIPAINLRTRFAFEKAPFDLRTRLIVVKVHDRNVGLIVDSAREFRNIPEESILPAPEALSFTNGNYIDGIATLGNDPILLLDLERVINANITETNAEQG